MNKKMLEALKLVEELEADAIATPPSEPNEGSDGESEGDQALELLRDIRDLMSELVNDEDIEIEDAVEDDEAKSEEVIDSGRDISPDLPKA